MTLSRSDKGPDSKFSLEPKEFAQMVYAVRQTEQALGVSKLEPTESERKSLVFRRSLFVVKSVKMGELFTQDNIRSIRPANGIHTRFYDDVIGRRASMDIEAGTPMSFEFLEK